MSPLVYINKFVCFVYGMCVYMLHKDYKYVIEGVTMSIFNMLNVLNYYPFTDATIGFTEATVSVEESTNMYTPQIEVTSANIEIVTGFYISVTYMNGTAIGMLT